MLQMRAMGGGTGQGAGAKKAPPGK
jgi:hypothetical protein